MRKLHKRYSKPRKKYDKRRIDEESEVIKKYGLKNKRELWKAGSHIGRLRNQAKELLVASQEEKKVFLSKLEKLGLIGKDAGLDDVLTLTYLNFLDRRLQTLLVSKNIAKTTKEARQMIVHKRVIVNDHVVNVPSYLVPKDLENKIRIKQKMQKDKKEKSSEQIQESAK